MKRAFLMFILSAVLVFGIAACGNQDKAEDSDAQNTAGNVELTEDQMDALLWQISQKEMEPQYKEYIPDECFANAEVYGTERNGNEGVIYAFLNEAEYVVVKDKAYDISGGAGEVIIRFNYTDENPELTEVVWSADGEEHDSWLKENFPKEYYDAAVGFQAYDENGNSNLMKELNEIVAEEMGVPVETENILEVGEDLNYKISKTIESGSPENGDYKFDTEVIEKGNLKDLK